MEAGLKPASYFFDFPPGRCYEYLVRLVRNSDLERVRARRYGTRLVASPMLNWSPADANVTMRRSSQTCGIEFLHLDHQRRDTGLVVGDLTPVSPRTDRHIHSDLGHIDSYVDAPLLNENLLANRWPILARCGLG